MADERDEVRARINIVDLVGQSVSLVKRGNTYVGLCPFHQDHAPSFHVAPEMGRYKCWACGEGGDIFEWVMKTRNVEFKDALQILAEQAGVLLKKQDPKQRSIRLIQRSAMDAALTFFRSQLEKSEQAKAYCARRCLGPDILAKWEIGYAPDFSEALALYLQKQGLKLADCKTLFLVDGNESQGYGDKFKARLMFPIRDERGDLVAFGGRLLGDGNPKYINSSDTPLYKKSRLLYGLHVAKDVMRISREAVLVEGYLDVIACHEAGVATAVASLGTSLSEDHAKLLKRWCDSVTILYDSDAAGQKAATRATEILLEEGLRVRVASVPEGKDPDTLLRAAGPEAVKKVATSGLSPLEYRIHQVEKAYEVTSEEFWIQATEAIAAEQSEFERLRFIEDLAPRYPKVRVAADARAALARMVERARSLAANGASPGAVAVRAVRPPGRPLALKIAETTIFRAVLDSEFREMVWPILLDPGLFVTNAGQKMSRKITESFPGGAPQGPPREWLEDIQDVRVKDVLIEIDADSRMRLTREFVEDAIADLKKKFDQRSGLTELLEADEHIKLRELMDRLRPYKV